MPWAAGLPEQPSTADIDSAEHRAVVSEEPLKFALLGKPAVAPFSTGYQTGLIVNTGLIDARFVPALENPDETAQAVRYQIECKGSGDCS